MNLFINHFYDDFHDFNNEMITQLINLYSFLYYLENRKGVSLNKRICEEINEKDKNIKMMNVSLQIAKVFSVRLIFQVLNENSLFVLLCCDFLFIFHWLVIRCEAFHSFLQIQNSQFTSNDSDSWIFYVQMIWINISFQVFFYFELSSIYSFCCAQFEGERNEYKSGKIMQSFCNIILCVGAESKKTNSFHQNQYEKWEIYLWSYKISSHSRMKFSHEIRVWIQMLVCIIKANICELRRTLSWMINCGFLSLSLIVFSYFKNVWKFLLEILRSRWIHEKKLVKMVLIYGENEQKQDEDNSKRQICISYFTYVITAVKIFVEYFSTLKLENWSTQSP